MSELIPITTPLREFKGHQYDIEAVAVFPDKRRMITSSCNDELYLWDLKTGKFLKNMGYHSVKALGISRDGKLIAGGGQSGKVTVWHGETGEFTKQINAHSESIKSLDFSPDGTTLAIVSYYDETINLWNTKTWKQRGKSIKCSGYGKYIRYSPSGELLAIASYGGGIQIYNPGTRKHVASWKGYFASLAWMPDGTCLLTGGDCIICEWDTTTWQQVGDPWTGHTSFVVDIAVNPAGTLVASTSWDNHVRLWLFSDRQTVAIFQHSSWVSHVTFCMDGNHILSGGGDKMISEWTVPNDINSKILATTLARDACTNGNLSATKALLTQDINTHANNHTSCAHHSKILAITTSRDACINGQLSTAEELLTQEINADANNHTSYAHRSFVMARQHNWDPALQDALKSISIQPSLTGYISKGIALCGQGHIREARAAFDVASMYTNKDSETVHFLLLIKAIVLFNGDQHDEANLLLKELAAGCPNADTRACHIVEAYLRVQLGIKALDGARHDEAADHFTAALSSNLSSKSDIHEIYKDLVVLFGWDLKSLWLTAHQKRCQAFLFAHKVDEALESHKSMMDNVDETTKASSLDWSTECSTLFLTNGDTALDASDYDRAIGLYSAVIDLNFASDAAFAKRSKAKLGKRLWMEALLDAQKVIQLNPSSYVGYELKHAALHGAQRYDEAIAAFKRMLSKLDNTPDTETRKFLSKVGRAIRRVIDAQLDNVPLRVLDTTTGLLCDREAQISTFKSSIEYRELVSSIIAHQDIQIKHVEEVVMSYFRYAMLSHRWEGKEPPLQDIQGKVVYDLDPVGGITKLQSFCKTARDLGYRWAWSDTCCIDKRSNTEVQESVNSMFVWYRHSALTIVYLSDVPPSSQPGALARSVWNERGWTFQEFVAPKVVIFYQKDWTLYLDDRSPNHKESRAIMKELGDATGIDARALVTFHPGMSGAREKLQWASKRVTTVQEDVAYSLFGIFGISLPVIYGEKKQNALGRLLQEIVARSGDITVLDWTGQPSEFNSCLPAHITSYTAPPRTLASLSEDDIHTRVSSLRQTVPTDLALEFYDRLQKLRAPRFANCRLHLPCILFRVTEVKRKHGLAQETRTTYEIKADGLDDLLVTTGETLVQFSWEKPIRQTFLLVRPWDRYLLGVHNFAEQPGFPDDMERIGNWTKSSSDSQMGGSNKLPGSSPVEEEPQARALRLMVRLGQPFDAFLLAQQHVGEYKRIASDHHIIAQIKDIASVDNINVDTVEIL